MPARHIAGFSALEPEVHAARGSVLAIGNFDGVHLGHQAVILAAADHAERFDLACYVLTFDPSPAEVLGKRAPLRLTQLERKVELLTRIHARVRVVVEPFTEALAAQSPEAFVRDFLVRHVSPRLVIVGNNFRFGRDRAGNLERLSQLGSVYGFEARAEALCGDAEGAYSSTRVRELIAHAELRAAARMLGRPHAVSGEVILGDQRGRTLGFPTANLASIAELLPPHGVYACLVDRVLPGSGAQRLGKAVANFGVRPTAGAGPSFEVHLLDFAKDLYGQRLRVHLVERLRGEQRFPDLAALKAQIGSDVAAARQLLAAAEFERTGAEPWY